MKENGVRSQDVGAEKTRCRVLSIRKQMERCKTREDRASQKRSCGTTSLPGRIILTLAGLAYRLGTSFPCWQNGFDSRIPLFILIVSRREALEWKRVAAPFVLRKNHSINSMSRLNTRIE